MFESTSCNRCQANIGIWYLALGAIVGYASCSTCDAKYKLNKITTSVITVFCLWLGLGLKWIIGATWVVSSFVAVISLCTLYAIFLSREIRLTKVS